MANPNKDIRPKSRSSVRSFRVGEAEAERSDAYAARLGVGTSALARAAYLDVVEAARVPTAIAAAIDSVQPQAASEDMRALRAAVNRVGGNFNQMLRLWNRAGGIQVIRCRRVCCQKAAAAPSSSGRGTEGDATGGRGAGSAAPGEIGQADFDELVALLREIRDLLREVRAVQVKLRGRW